ncbi:short-chain dehydrogenase [Botrytis cinerea]
MSILNYWTIAALVLGLAAFAPGIMGVFGLGGNKFLVKGKTVLLTGASEGMGKSVAIQLAKKGANVIIVARNVGKLEKAMVEIKAAALSPSTQSFHYISADVSISTEAARILEEATKFNSSNPPDIVWCIAGTSTPGFFLDTTPQKLRTQMDINYWSCADMAHCTIASPGLEIENQGKPEITHLLEETDPIQTPDEVARNSIRGLERGEYLITVGWLGSMMRACAWGGSRRGNWVLDTLVTWGTSVVWGFVGRDLDGKVRRWGEVKGFKRN